MFLALEIPTRRISHCNATEHPTNERTAQRSVPTGDEPYRFVVHDRDAVFAAHLRLLKMPASREIGSSWSGNPRHSRDPRLVVERIRAIRVIRGS